MSIALDSVANSAYTGSSVSSNTCSLSTSGTNRVVLAYVSATATSGTPTISSVSGGSLTWAKRSGQTFAGNSGHTAVMEVWWAWAASQLTTQTITVTAGGTYDHVEISCETYSGVPSGNSANPFDSNGSLPAYYKYESGTNQQSNTTGNCPTVTTTNANTMLLGMFHTTALPANRADTPNGWTETNNKRNSAGTDWDHIVGQYFLKTATVSSFNVGFRDNVNRYGIIGDALTSDSANATSTIDSTLSGTLATVFNAVETEPSAIASVLPGAIITAWVGGSGYLTSIDQTLSGALITNVNVESYSVAIAQVLQGTLTQAFVARIQNATIAQTLSGLLQTRAVFYETSEPGHGTVSFHWAAGP